MSRFIVLAALAACGGGDDLAYDVNPGGGGGSGSSHVTDAAVVDDGGAGSDASATVTGRVCLLGDSRAPTACAASGAGGFTVAVGGAEATTAGDGSFVIATPSGSNLVWRVSGTGIVSSAMRYAATATTIPAISANLYGDMISANTPSVDVGQGALIAQVTRGTTPVQNIAAALTPTSTSGIYYDGPTSASWNFGTATGPFGALWIPGVSPGTVALTLDDGSAAPPVVSNIPIFADTITFVFYKLP